MEERMNERIKVEKEEGGWGRRRRWGGVMWLEPRPWLTAVIKSSYLTRDVTGNCCLRALRPLCRFNYLWRCDSKAINNNPSWSLHTEALPCVFSWHRDQRQRIAKKQNLNRPVMAVPRLLNLLLFSFFYPRPLLSSIKCYRLWNCSLYMSRFYCSKKNENESQGVLEGSGVFEFGVCFTCQQES